LLIVVNRENFDALPEIEYWYETLAVGGVSRSRHADRQNILLLDLV
jgi:hypothetical protein